MLPSDQHWRPASGLTNADAKGQFAVVPGCDRPCSPSFARSGFLRLWNKSQHVMLSKQRVSHS